MAVAELEVNADTNVPRVGATVGLTLTVATPDDDSCPASSDEVQPVQSLTLLLLYRLVAVGVERRRLTACRCDFAAPSGNVSCSSEEVHPMQPPKPFARLVEIEVERGPLACPGDRAVPSKNSSAEVQPVHPPEPLYIFVTAGAAKRRLTLPRNITEAAVFGNEAPNVRVRTPHLEEARERFFTRNGTSGGFMRC